MQILLRRILPLVLAVLVLGGGANRIAGSSDNAQAVGLGGPVILGGDDLTDHGSKDGSGNAVDGWLYIQRAIENIGPNVTRSGNDGSIAALGSAAGSLATSDDAGAAIDLAGSKTSRSVTHYDGVAAIDTFFANLASSTTNPAIIHLAGTGARNDFDTSETAAITAHAAEIASFVSSGGGLLSHGTFYGWLTALLPDASTVLNGSSDDLYFTPDGLIDLPSLTVANINAGPWHNYFEGNLGGLKVLVRSSSVLDKAGADAPVIIGGSKVTFAEQTPDVPSATPQLRLKTQTPTRTATAAATSTPTPVTPTNTPAVTNTPVSSPTPTGGRAGVIVGPNTGSGPGGGSSRSLYLFGAALLVAGVGIAGAAVRKTRRG